MSSAYMTSCPKSAGIGFSSYIQFSVGRDSLHFDILVAAFLLITLLCLAKCIKSLVNCQVYNKISTAFFFFILYVSSALTALDITDINRFCQFGFLTMVFYGLKNAW